MYRHPCSGRGYRKGSRRRELRRGRVKLNPGRFLADIQIVGVRRLEEFEAFYDEPVFIMVMGCKTCGQWTNHTMRRSRADATAGCVSFIQLIEQECQGKKPPLSIPGLGKKTKSSTSRVDAAQRAAVPPLRPSIRENQPDTPPTQREIQYFLHRLRKVTFKRGSKGLNEWLKDLGAGSDGEEGGAGDE